MDLRTAALGLAASRVAYGAGMVLAPTHAARMWVGRRARDPRAQVLARALGARDLVLGLGSLLALRGGDRMAARPWFAAQVATDSVDLLATLGARALPAPARAFTVAAAAGSLAVAAAYATQAGDAPEPPDGLRLARGW
jgi:hypothetical protein